MKIPAFAKGKLKKRIIPAEKDFFGDPIGQPQIIYFLSLPQFPKDSLILYPERAIQKGEIITAPIEHKTLYPEAVELLQEDYIPALIKAGCLTYTDQGIRRICGKPRADGRCYKQPLRVSETASNLTGEAESSRREV